MSILCLMFGHKPPTYAPNMGGDYMKLVRCGVDGIGRQHAWLKGNCPRCGEQYTVGSTHLIPLKDHDQ